MADEDDYSYVSPQGRIVGKLVPIERVEAARREERERVLREIEAHVECGMTEPKHLAALVRRLREGT